jgi:hypothetical protein
VASFESADAATLSAQAEFQTVGVRLMTRFAITGALTAYVMLLVSVARAEDFGARFPELRLNLSLSTAPVTTSLPAPSTLDYAPTKLDSLFIAQLIAPVASSAIQPAAITEFSPSSPYVGLGDDPRTAPSASGRYGDLLRAQAPPSSATSSLIQPLVLPTIRGMESSNFQKSSALFGGAHFNQSGEFWYR